MFKGFRDDFYTYEKFIGEAVVGRSVVMGRVMDAPFF
jgi:hypothetical protein